MGSETDHRFSSGEGSWGCLRPAAFVGRAVELGMFDAALERAVRFRAPQFVTAVGALGAGKTRLWAEWLAEVAGPGVRIARVALSAPGSAQSRGNLVGSLLRQRFGIAPHFSAEAALVQFRGEIRRVFADRHVAEVAALLGRFLGFELRESPLSHAISGAPGQGRDLARAVLCRFLEQDARDAPLVLAVDDLHLADEESLEILERIPAELGPSSLVLLATARQDLMLRRPQWGTVGSGSIRIDLAPLRQDAVGAMIRSVLDIEDREDGEAGEAVPPSLVERVSVESGGNPYLVEQLLHVYRRHGVLDPQGEGGWSFDADSAGAAAIPLGPEEVAQARVVSLSPIERAVLARAATFGQVFWTGGVVALGRVSTEPSDPISVFGPDQSILDLRDILEDLGRRDLLQRAAESSLPGDAEWLFRHAGDVDLILAEVDPSALAQMRRFAAQWLESRGGAGREARFEMLGRLYEDGGDSRRAAYCFLSAAEDAAQRAEAERARSLYLRAVRLLETDDAVAKMDALYALGDLAARLGRTREALAHFGEMLVISWRLDLPSKGGAAHGRIARLHATLGEHQAALGHLDVARALFEAAGDLAGIASTLDDMGRVHLLNGAPEMSLEF
ncbi:MAG TPA: AAA family ATPase, partial [Polyangia bacterium]